MKLRYPFAFMLMTACSPNVSDELAASDSAILDELSQTMLFDARELNPVTFDSGLQAAFSMALDRSPKIAAANGEFMAALSEVRAAQAARRPQSSATIRSGVLEEDGAAGNSYSGAYGNISVSQLLYDGGATQAIIEASSLRASIAAAELDQTRNEVLFEATQAWNELWKSRGLYALLEARINELTELTSQVQRMAQSGMVDSAILDNAVAQLSSVQSQRDQLANSVGRAEVEFVRLFGITPEIIDNPITISEGLDLDNIDNLMNSAPSLRISAARALLSEAQYRQADASLSPRVALEASANSPVDTNDPNTASVGLSLQYTITSGGRRRAEIDAAEQRREAIRSAFLSEVELFRAVAVTLDSELSYLRAELERTSERKELAERAVETLRSQLVTGQSNLQSLIDAEIAYFRSQQDVFNARFAYSEFINSTASKSGLLSAFILNAD